jgi:PRTRC genetic system ThiF family protein
MNTKKAMHFTANYLLNPTNPITVNLIGAGGTGSQMLTALARINHSLKALGHAGLQLTLFDDDKVTEANLGRQLFAEAELGLYKSVALISRVNRFFGTDWKGVPLPFAGESLHRIQERAKANLYISCVDTVSARFDIANVLKEMDSGSRFIRNRAYYWLDMGNARDTGQALLATISEVEQPRSQKYRTVEKLPMITEEYKNLLEAAADNNEPSCSLAEALTKQDLFINTAIAGMGASLLWQLLGRGMTENRGFFMNLGDFRTYPVRVG